MNQTLEKSFRMAMIMTAMAAVTVGFIVWMFGFSPVSAGLGANREAFESGGVLDILRLAFWGLAVLMIVAFFWLRGRTPSPERLWQTFVFSLALAEGAGVFGAVLFGITGNKTDLVLVALSACLLALNFPQRSRWEGCANSEREQG